MRLGRVTHPTAPRHTVMSADGGNASTGEREYEEGRVSAFVRKMLGIEDANVTVGESLSQT